MSIDNYQGRIEKWVKVYAPIPIEDFEKVSKEIDNIKNDIERILGTKITLDRQNSVAIIEPRNEKASPADLIKAKDIIVAASIGFSKEEVLDLLNTDNILITIDIKSRIGNSPNHIKRIMGRIIGEDGRAKKTLEEITGTIIHVGNNMVGIIGDYDRAVIAQHGIDMLIEGKMHSTVYKKLEEMMREIKRKDITSIWEKRNPF
ncbi:MAG: KH domain-containing protein [Caldisphaera sp.]|jgi:ribosomal RNA assembly protein|nr:MAG: RNA-processing protein [Caldisphaera sp.]